MRRRYVNNMAAYSYPVQSLKRSCLHEVAKHVTEYQNSLEWLPLEIKDKLVKLFAFRGLLNDDILPKVIIPSIRELDLSESDPTDAGLRVITCCKGLKKLDLNAVKEHRANISTNAIIEIVKSCTKLQTVYLRRCVNISDEAIVALAQNCPYLQYLNIANCNITDESLAYLAKNSKFLQCLNISKTMELHVAHCNEVSDDSLEAVLMLCPQISILIFHGCPLVTERIRYAMEEVAERGGKLKQVTWTIY